MDDKLKIIVSGAGGRMGSLIRALVNAASDLTVAGEAEVDRPLENIVTAGDVIIDFSVCEAAAGNALTAAKHGVPIVIGTTGLQQEDEAKLRQASEVIPVVYAPNMSVGVNLLWKLAADAAKVLTPKFKVDITEEHHIHKKDRPSGTAKKLLDVVMEEGSFNKERDVLICEESFPEEKNKQPVNVCSIRQGETVGNHTIRFISEGEVIEITHRAFGREVFAQGALAAARWVRDKKPGLYSMADVLGIQRSEK